MGSKEEMLKNNPVIAKQLQFVEWLKSKGLYNEFDTAHTMCRMQDVWESCFIVGVVEGS